MNIVMVSLDFPPVVGGISAHVYELSKALIRLGHNVSVFTRQRSSKEQGCLDLESIKVYKFKLKFVSFVYGLQINKFIKEKISSIKTDIIHIHGMAPLEWYNIKSPPLVYTNHTSGYLKRIKKGGLRRTALLKRILKKPKLFLAPSKELLEAPFHIPAKKKFIPNGVDSQKYKFNQQYRNNLRQKLNIKDNDILGILTRRLVKKNGVIYFAKATQYIKNTHLKLLIIGDGNEKNKIEKELNKYFRDRFVMLGAKFHDEIIPYYSASDFSILPSLMEATSISGLEAMAASLPIVGTKVGGIPEIIKNGFNGFLCNPADEHDLAEKIDVLLSQNYKKLGSNSKRLIEEKFDWSEIAQQTIKAYKSIL